MVLLKVFRYALACIFYRQLDVTTAPSSVVDSLQGNRDCTRLGVLEGVAHEIADNSCPAPCIID